MSWSSNCGRFFLPAPGSLWVWEMDIPYVLFQAFKIDPGVCFQIFRASVWGQAFPESFLPSGLSSSENLATYSVLGEEKSCSEPGPTGGAASLMVLHWDLVPAPLGSVPTFMTLTGFWGSNSMNWAVSGDWEGLFWGSRPSTSLPTQHVGVWLQRLAFIFQKVVREESKPGGKNRSWRSGALQLGAFRMSREPSEVFMGLCVRRLRHCCLLVQMQPGWHISRL